MAMSRCNQEGLVPSDQSQTLSLGRGTMRWKMERPLVFWGSYPVPSFPEWNRQAIDERQKYLAKLTHDVWGMPA
jgi:hypothetical protein